MTDLTSRVAAIGELLTDKSLGSPAPEVIEAGLTCANDLVDAGEPKAALGLLERLALTENLSPPSTISMTLVQVRAFRAAGEHRAAHEIAKKRIEEIPEILESSSGDGMLLRIHMAGCLWQMNRVDESV